MIDKINGRTPKEIKQKLEKCPNADCSLCLSSFHCALEADALAYIQQLERERDAAVNDLRQLHCASCIYEDVDQEEAPCVNCHRNCGLNHYFAGEEVDNWQWRGVEVE